MVVKESTRPNGRHAVSNSHAREAVTAPFYIPETTGSERLLANSRHAVWNNDAGERVGAKSTKPNGLNAAPDSDASKVVTEESAITDTRNAVAGCAIRNSVRNDYISGKVLRYTARYFDRRPTGDFIIQTISLELAVYFGRCDSPEASDKVLWPTRCPLTAIDHCQIGIAIEDAVANKRAMVAFKDHVSEGVLRKGISSNRRHVVWKNHAGKGVLRKSISSNRLHVARNTHAGEGVVRKGISSNRRHVVVLENHAGEGVALESIIPNGRHAVVEVVSAASRGNRYHYGRGTVTRCAASYACLTVIRIEGDAITQAIDIKGQSLSR